MIGEGVEAINDRDDNIADSPLDVNYAAELEAVLDEPGVRDAVVKAIREAEAEASDGVIP